MCAHGVPCTRVACACIRQCTHVQCTHTHVGVGVGAHMHRPGGGVQAAHTLSPRAVQASASAGTRSPSCGTRGSRHRRTLVIDMCPLSWAFRPHGNARPSLSVAGTLLFPNAVVGTLWSRQCPASEGENRLAAAESQPSLPGISTWHPPRGVSGTMTDIGIGPLTASLSLCL